jgi:hypothetical protein
MVQIGIGIEFGLGIDEGPSACPLYPGGIEESAAFAPLPGCGIHHNAPFPGCVLRTTRGYPLPSLRDARTREA